MLRKQLADALKMKNGLIVSVAIGTFENHPENREIPGFLQDLSVDSDVENLRKLAEYLNYTFLLKEDKYSWTKDEVMSFLEEDVAEVLFDGDGNIQFDGLIVSVSSHGQGNSIITSDYQRIKRTDIHRCLSEKYPQIREIPRIYLFDACDGTRSRVATPSANGQIVETEKPAAAGSSVENVDLSVVDALQMMDTEWSSKHKNPDYNMIIVHGANEGFVSKIQNTEVGSYLTYFFTKAVRLNIEMGQRKGMGEILADVQNTLHDAGKQLIRMEFFNNTQNLGIEVNADKSD